MPAQAIVSGVDPSKAAATLSGTVTDPTGAIIANGSVLLSGPGRQQQQQTDRLGRFSFSVPPGKYLLTVESVGFASFASRSLALAAAKEVNLPIRLAVAGRSERVDVEPQRGLSTDPNENGSAIELSGDQLNQLSSDPATLQQQINALAGPGLGGNTQVLVNGFSNGRLPPKAAIRSIRINHNPFSAVYDSPGFGRVEIETKPGTDKLHGSLNFAGSDTAFNAQNPYNFGGPNPPYYQFQTDGSLTGPITKKIAFFVADSVQQLANNAIVNAEILDAGFNPGGLSEALPQPQLIQAYSARVDEQFSPTHFGFVRNEWTQTHTNNSGINPLVLPSATYTSNVLSNTLQAADTQVLGPHAVNQVRFQYLRTRVGQQPNSNAPTLNVQGSFLGGGSMMQVLHDNADRYELQQVLEFDRGNHSVRTGFRFREVRNANTSSANFNGEYTFDSLSAYQITERNIAACAAAMGLSCLTPAQLRLAGGGASQFNLTAGQTEARLLEDDFSVFAEDDWKVKKNVTFSYGFRFESQSAVPDHANPAPRVGVSWAPHHGKSPVPLVVLRAGYGIFYDRFPAANLLQAVRQNGRTETAFFVQNPDTFPTVPTPASLVATEPTIFRVNPALRTSYNQVTSLSADRYLGRKGVLSATLLLAHGTHEYLTRNINAPLPNTVDPTIPGSGTRPLGGSENIYQFSSDSNENDEVFTLNARLRPTKRISLLALYEYQHQANETAGSTSFASNQYNLKQDYARESGIPVHTAQFVFFYNLPKNWGAALFLNAHSGPPFNITTGTDANGDTIFNDRPAFATDLTRASVVRTAFGNFDTAPLPGQNLIPRNYGNSPGLVWVDLQLNRDFHVGPRAKAAIAGSNGTSAAESAKPDRPWDLKFQVEAQNLFNHNNPGVPVGVLAAQPCTVAATTAAPGLCASPAFGRSLSLASDFSPLTASNRTILLQSFFTF
ncbi:MAG: carboxypeptidase regulatory-like domain-containing protein [Janthinobacterium lividum]